MKSVDQDSIALLRSMGASQRKIFRHLQLPAALPHVFGGMKVAITLATVGAIVAEFVGADRGLGYVLLYANGVINSRLLFAALTLISALALAFYWAVGLLERLCIPWHTSMRAEPLRGTL